MQMIHHIPVFRRPGYQEISNRFRKLEYDQALPGFEELLFAPDLDVYDRCVLWIRIANCHYGIITRDGELKHADTSAFFNAMARYLEYLSQTEQSQPESLGESRDDAGNLLREAIELRLRFHSDTLTASITDDVRACSGIRWFGSERSLSALIEKIFEERRNFDRDRHILNTRDMALGYLDLTESADVFVAGRVQIMNLLSDIAYFEKGDAGDAEALEWAIRCLTIKPDDRFALARKQFITERHTVRDQIRRFEHDTNSAIAGMVYTLDRILAAPDRNAPEVLIRLKTCRRELDRIRAVHRFVADRQADWTKEINPVAGITEIAEKYLEYAEVDVETVEAPPGPDLKWNTDMGYLGLALDNLLKNAREAFDRRRIPRPDRRIVIRIDVQNQSITVRDNAGGIDPSLRDRIFDPYISTKGIRQKTGLGLAQARMAIENKLEGSLTLAQDQPRDGAAFVIRLRTRGETR
jgi:hypothetical protein